MAEIQKKSCVKCGKAVMILSAGTIVHDGAGTVEQRCKSCGWTGGQIGKYITCPRCGDMTNLLDDHIAA